jgi:hypothetical protein
MKTRRPIRLAVLAVLAAAGTVLLPNGNASAVQSGQVQTTIRVIAEGLDTPRGVIYDPFLRRVLVAEAGEVASNRGTCAPGNGGVIYCFGTSGAIFRYSELGFPSRRIVTGLPSLRTEDDSAVLGVHDLDLRFGHLYVVFGLSGNLAFRTALGPEAIGLAQTGRIDIFGRLHPNGDLSTFEETNNPDGRRIDSDPFGLLAQHDGSLVVADAAGNALVHVKNGVVSLLQFLPPRDFMGDPDYESVPTSVSKGPDGAYYVSELSGFPYHKGSARILRVVPGAATPITVAAEGFTNIADFLFDERGRLVVLEMSTNSLTDPVDPVTGRLVRVEHDGTKTDLATTGLENPGGVAYAGRGVFYVTNRTTGTGDNGQLLKITVRG